MAAVGGVLSTVTVIGEIVVTFPARSLTERRRSYAPSASAVVSQAAGVSVQVPAPLGEYW